MKTYTNGNLSNEVYYRDNIEIRNNDVIVNHSNGRIVYENGSGDCEYQYYLKDHLGNVRLTFAACPQQVPCKNANLSVINENHYYPFGMKMEGDWNSKNTANPEVTNQYNGKEWVDDLGLAMNDYGARWYDPATARWSSVDPLAEKYVGHSPYNYVLGNPIKYIDPDGRSVLNSVSESSYYIDDRYGTSLTMILSDELFSSIVSSNPGANWFRQLDWSNYISFMAKSVEFDLTSASSGLKSDYGAFGWLIAELGYVPASVTLNELGEGNYGSALFEAGIEIGLKHFKVGKIGVELGLGQLTNKTKALKPGKLEIRQWRLDHIIERHWHSSGALNAGKFNKMSGKEFKKLLETVVEKGTFRKNINPKTGKVRSGMVVEYDFGDNIGYKGKYNRTHGRPTSRVRIILNSNNTGRTAHPY